MKIADVLEEQIRWARERKEGAVAESHDTDRPDVPPWLTGWRGDHPVISMMPVNGDRNIVLHAAKIMAVAFGCDIVSTNNETWMAVDAARNPVTGEEWGHGEMEDVALHHDGLAKGWITEAMTLMVVNRAGDMATAILRFTVTPHTNALGITSWSIEWGKEERWTSEETDRGSVMGVIPETLIEFMNEPDLMTQAMQDPIGQQMAAGLSLEEQRAHADCAVIKMLPRFGFEGAAMLMSDNPERQAVIEDSLAGNPWLYDIWKVDGGWEQGDEN